GQPLHTFDFARLAGGRIAIRPAAEGETIQTLDGQARALNAGMLVIADAAAPIAVAGVMGGAASEVTADTRRILLEAAHFAPTAVRRAAQALGLRTEASARFEKGLDPNLCELAADRAAALLAELAGGRVAAGKVDVQAAPLPRPRRLTLRPERVGAMLGVQLSPAEIRRRLTALGFGVELEARHLVVEVPTFRGDVEGEADLIEEVARLYGFDRIEATLPVGESLPGGYMSPLDRYERVRDLLVAAGLHEAITYSFINAEALDRLDLADDDARRRAVPLRNPLSEEHAVMRTSLLPGLLAAAAYNRRRRIESVRLFELGTVFMPREWPITGQPDEVARLGALLTGGPPAAIGEAPRAYDFYDAKGLVELLAERFAAGLEVRDGAEPFLHPGRQAALVSGDGRALGFVGQLHPAVAGAFDLDGEVYALELDLGVLCAGDFTPRHSRVSRYPRVQRDLAILVDKGVYAARIEAAIMAAAGPLLVHLALFDVYEGERIPKGMRSLAYALSFGSNERTLTEDEVERAIEQVVAHLRTNLNAEIRGRA
ncbi:MAG TPA: phenylalanine--tRNA ligase subunit beta, partial [Limnochordia bacterium]|nr:phenylalanine--tRNA ligase subunit beta [Limnochordia bacterium]